ncbi:hypothetical protein AYL99_01072 [Fonsecaea erecta]|uniref:Uncharacterized protein n=1 Tax=Fonsecaea erecta TaxID=1367422 RepID=A0A178ZZ00_9EURO|nr:hypothetical protein AYL99_01072 [Fonsecaea erecta]OAP65100.1 hypothetical protein AYL99_01072 [Fonsecaea erecta]
MAFSNQFSLSVELTKLVPLGNILSAAGSGILNLARDLRRSGSDITVEEDLTLVLGRNRICPKFESTFRVAVRGSSQQQIGEFVDIILEAGAGPTVQRSLKHPPYFSTVAQLSLLAFTQQLNRLSWTLSKLFERRLSGAPQHLQSHPSAESMRGTLRACREQTAGFNWTLLFEAVECVLGCDKRPLNAQRRVPHDLNSEDGRNLPIPILQGCLDMLTAVQTLPEDRMIHINAETGYSAIVVWAHHLLGLTVEVRKYRHKKGYVFGNGPEQIIFCINKLGPTICLMDKTDEILRIGEFDMDPPLTPDIRATARGFGIKLLQSSGCSEHNMRSEAEVAVAVATGQSGRHLKPGLLRAAQILFHGLELEFGNGLDGIVAKFATKNTTYLSAYLAKALIAFSSIKNIDSCHDLPLCISRPFMENVKEGEPDIFVQFRYMARLLLGSEYNESVVSRSALVSAWGWSICLTSVGAQCPTQVDGNMFLVRRGVPSRNGERSRFIVDGPRTSGFSKAGPDHYSRPFPQGPTDATPVADFVAEFPNAKPAYYIGLSDQAFEVSVCFELSKYPRRYTGFRRMQGLRTQVIMLRESGCEHHKRATPPKDTVALPVGCETIEFYHANVSSTGEKEAGIRVSKTLDGPAYRWFQLDILSAAAASDSEDSNQAGTSSRERTQIDGLFLKSGQCCLPCAVDIVDRFCVQETRESRKPTNFFLIA